jgi:hypothetical protein
MESSAVFSKERMDEQLNRVPYVFHQIFLIDVQQE